MFSEEIEDLAKKHQPIAKRLRIRLNPNSANLQGCANYANKQEVIWEKSVDLFNQNKKNLKRPIEKFLPEFVQLVSEQQELEKVDDAMKVIQDFIK